MRRVVVIGVLAAAALAPTAASSNLIDRDAIGVRLIVTRDGAAHLLYTARGKAQHVVAWGAINADFPTRGKKQVEFKVNYSGGWRTPYFVKDPSSLVNTCGRYDGPKLPFFVVGCRARDGSYWAIQSWQRMLPNLGVKAPPDLAVHELRLSHWKGPLPVLTVGRDWAYAGKWQHLYGSLKYLGRPMYGFGTTRYGAPTDNWGDLIYLDTFNSPWGRGWRRVDSFVSHNPKGIFCYVLSDKHGRPAGAGSKYRMTAVGPGVLPDVVWRGRSLGAYNARIDAEADAEQRRSYTDGTCTPSTYASVASSAATGSPRVGEPPAASGDGGLSGGWIALVAAAGVTVTGLGLAFLLRRRRSNL
jgi:hypothetical protein